MKLIYHILIAPILRILVILLALLCVAIISLLTCAYMCLYPLITITYWVFTGKSFEFDFDLLEDSFNMVLSCMFGCIDKIKEYGK